MSSTKTNIISLVVYVSVVNVYIELKQVVGEGGNIKTYIQMCSIFQSVRFQKINRKLWMHDCFRQLHMHNKKCILLLISAVQ